MATYWKIIDGSPDFIIGGGDYKDPSTGKTHPHPSRMSADQCAALDIAPEGTPQVMPDARYYSFTETPALVDGEVIKTYPGPTPKDLATVKAAKISDAAAARYAAEIGGITVSGMTVQTDRDSQALIMAARILAKEDANYTVKWKTASGFVVLDATQTIALADAVRAHVQGCFDAESDHITAINALNLAQDVIDYEVIY